VYSVPAAATAKASIPSRAYKSIDSGPAAVQKAKNRAPTGCSAEGTVFIWQLTLCWVWPSWMQRQPLALVNAVPRPGFWGPLARWVAGGGAAAANAWSVCSIARPSDPNDLNIEQYHGSPALPSGSSWDRGAETVAPQTPRVITFFAEVLARGQCVLHPLNVSTLLHPGLQCCPGCTPYIECVHRACSV
jgi:hypothetical protein